MGFWKYPLGEQYLDKFAGLVTEVYQLQFAEYQQ